MDTLLLVGGREKERKHHQSVSQVEGADSAEGRKSQRSTTDCGGTFGRPRYFLGVRFTSLRHSTTATAEFYNQRRISTT